MTTRADIEDMLARVAMGDREAFAALYRATSAKLFGVCLRVLIERAEAEEAVQEIYIKIWRNADRYAAGGYSPMTWLITIARNHAIDRLRKRRAMIIRGEAGGGTDGDGGSVLDRMADDAPGAEAQMIAQGDARRITGCLGELEPDRSEAVQRAYLSGETYADLAAHFNVPLNTMRTWLRRSLLKLKECLSR
ncbi:RNA polymerase subunit sigma [Litorivita pollutaquae]|uniref:RNA polymerase subunit sigma n=1 Tax=Litorivita pollutaquae TaxID=2200892 RepID=A0A2V4MPC4_9RHOB|nr:sigma-70 family RNA polymerase sigma factor [Litorivita pollutaquae]PYC48581.1 RNA polymerase subunit sigma [Litorivita pollutaquae]